MALQLSVSSRNARLDSIETTVGTSALLRIFSGSAPANCATADSGTKLVEMTLPSNWMNDAATGSKTLLGTWSGTGLATNTAGYFRIYDSGAVACHLQGTCGLGSGDLSLDNTSIAVGQSVSVTAFTLTDSNS